LDATRHHRGAKHPSFSNRLPKKEGAGNAGRAWHPQPVCNGSKHTVVTTGTPNVRRFLRNGFNGLLRTLPGDEFLLSPSSAD